MPENCEFCGMPLPETKKMGRKPKFHPNCGQASRSLEWIIARLGETEMSLEARKRLRKKLFSIANAHTKFPLPDRDDAGRFIKTNE